MDIWVLVINIRMVECKDKDNAQLFQDDVEGLRRN